MDFVWQQKKKFKVYISNRRRFCKVLCIEIIDRVVERCGVCASFVCDVNFNKSNRHEINSPFYSNILVGFVPTQAESNKLLSICIYLSICVTSPLYT